MEHDGRRRRKSRTLSLQFRTTPSRTEHAISDDWEILHEGKRWVHVEAKAHMVLWRLWRSRNGKHRVARVPYGMGRQAQARHGHVRERGEHRPFDLANILKGMLRVNQRAANHARQLLKYCWQEELC
ncbi:hypothetical protein B0H14DRAFT_2582689 [Mycena olivaceomarginata]|nr:hypothetical protein B0H14DRAFT_2582689 [Mycena olivaceomarginata]